MNPPLRNVTLQEAKDAGYDCVQLKLRGPSMEKSLGSTVLQGITMPDCSVFYECISVGNLKTRMFSYRDRYALAYAAIGNTGDLNYKIVGNYTIDFAKKLWKQLDVSKHCGIIFRRSHGTWDDEVLCQRWYPEIPKDLV